MLEDWQTFLEEQGANILANRIESFKSSDAEIKDNSLILSDLSHYSLVKVSGSEASSFLQGQLSNDINAVSTDQSQMSSYCSPKGRVLAFFRIFQLENNYFLSFPSDIAEKTLQRLRMFVMRSDVTFTDVTAEFFHFGLSGSITEAESALKDVLKITNVPSETDQAIETNQISLQKLPDSKQARYEIFGPYEQAKELWKAFAQHGQAVAQSIWELQRIHAGVPEVTSNIVDAFVPQMLNLQLINAVNFQKGCYPGQEIVARTKYLGKLKKRLYLAEITTENPIEVGTDLFESGDNQQSVGKIVSSAHNLKGAISVLVVLRISATSNQPLFLENKSGPQIELLDLPYKTEE